ncbi:unnamed protein product, partial [Schistosoma intercalatum]
MKVKGTTTWFDVVFFAVGTIYFVDDVQFFLSFRPLVCIGLIEVIFRGDFVEILEISLVKIMSQLKLDHHGKPGSTGRPFRSSMGLLSSAHPRPRPLRDSTPGPTGSARDHLTTEPVYNGVN